jgi:hypothetical protein
MVSGLIARLCALRLTAQSFITAQSFNNAEFT